jgi:hypothetical protein
MTVQFDCCCAQVQWSLSNGTAHSHCRPPKRRLGPHPLVLTRRLHGWHTPPATTEALPGTAGAMEVQAILVPHMPVHMQMRTRLWHAQRLHRLRINGPMHSKSDIAQRHPAVMRTNRSLGSNAAPTGTICSSPQAHAGAGPPTSTAIDHHCTLVAARHTMQQLQLLLLRADPCSWRSHNAAHARAAPARRVSPLLTWRKIFS